MASDKDKDSSVPTWDGSAKTWRKYHREVAWYVRSTPPDKRRYCAHRLVSKLTGPARLLAMSWTSVSFDHEGGAKDYLQRLASSPLVRQSLPNAAAICQQYFAFRRNQGESMQSFLVRESLGYAEFSEALIQLYQEKIFSSTNWTSIFLMIANGWTMMMVGLHGGQNKECKQHPQ